MITPVLDGPLTVGWDITKKCNLNCKHCYANAGQAHPREFTLEEIKNIVDELSSLGTVLIALAGGEPFTRKDLVDIVGYIKSKGMEVFLNTNGTLITKPILNSLKDAGLTHIELSIDGLKEQHDFIRGVNSFERALRGFDLAQEQGFRVGVMSTLFKHNYQHVRKFIDFFHDKGAIGIGFLRFITSGRGAFNPDMSLTVEERKKAIEFVYQKRMEYGEGFYLKVETPLSYLVAETHQELMKVHNYVNLMQRGCDGGITSCQILVDGTVTFCPQMSIGNHNVREKPMSFIWKNDETFKKLRTREFSGKCGRCAYTTKCGGCRVDAFLTCGDVLGEDSGCWLEV